MSIVKEFIAGLLKKREAKMVHGSIQELISKKNGRYSSRRNGCHTFR